MISNMNNSREKKTIPLKEPHVQSILFSEQETA